MLEGRVRFRCSGRDVEVGARRLGADPAACRAHLQGPGPRHGAGAGAADPRARRRLLPSTPRGWTRPDMDRIREIAREYDLEFTGPPDLTGQKTRHSMAFDASTATVNAWRRENGRVGVRNHVVDPAGRRHLERLLRGGGEQRQGDDGAAAFLWPAAVRRGSGPALPDDDRHRRQPERRGLHRHRHRAGMDQGDRRRDRRDGQAGRRLLDRAERRLRDDPQGQLEGQGVRPLGDRAAERTLPGQRSVDLDQMRRVGHDDGAGVLPDGRQHVRQAAADRHLRLLWRDQRDHRGRAHLQGAAPPRRRPARSSWRSSKPIRTR